MPLVWAKVKICLLSCSHRISRSICHHNVRLFPECATSHFLQFWLMALSHHHLPPRQMQYLLTSLTLTPNPGFSRRSNSFKTYVKACPCAIISNGFPIPLGPPGTPWTSSPTTLLLIPSFNMSSPSEALDTAAPSAWKALRYLFKRTTPSLSLFPSAHPQIYFSTLHWSTLH